MPTPSAGPDPVGPLDAQRVPRFFGPGTFARLPEIHRVNGYDLAILGVPFDAVTSYRPGAQFGPDGRTAGVPESAAPCRAATAAVTACPVPVRGMASFRHGRGYGRGAAHRARSCQDRPGRSWAGGSPA
ncbi:arginase family protein [Actinacidiphila oryziradicis]|uniref:Agmatinase n=1 Tax=Actinacidiphila oryziradicis TaxID=2571141 RepID=A0A4U0SFL0_9ACTN|nr:hypothetical protein FCI23_29460 [Actinacidiphila oryziradicis]